MLPDAVILLTLPNGLPDKSVCPVPSGTRTTLPLAPPLAREMSPPALPLYPSANIVLATSSSFNTPKLVTFGCALVVNVPVNKLAPIVPLLA